MTISDILTDWFSSMRRGGEIDIDYAAGRVWCHDAHANMDYQVQLEPHDSLHQRLKDAFAEAKGVA